MKKLSAFLLCLYLVFIIGCYNVYKNIITETNLQEINKLIVIADIKSKYRYGEDREKEQEKTGIGIKVNETTYIFLTHVVQEVSYVQIHTPIGMMLQPVHCLEHAIKVNGKELEFVGNEHDISVLKVKGTDLNAEFNIPVANIDEVKVGSLVYVIGFSHALCKNFKFGNISYFLDKDDTEKMNIQLSSGIKPYERLIMLNMPTYPGDSGSMVFVKNIKTGQMEIIGIVGLKGDDNVGLAYRIDDIVKSYEKLYSHK